MKADRPRLTAAGISGLFFVKKSVLNRCGGDCARRELEGHGVNTEPQSCATAVKLRILKTRILRCEHPGSWMDRGSSDVGLRLRVVGFKGLGFETSHA